MNFKLFTLIKSKDTQMTNLIVSDVETGWANFISWFNSEDAKLVAFVQPVIKELASYAKQDVLTDLAQAIPVAIETITGGGGYEEAIAAIEAILVPALKKQMTTLSDEAAAFLTNAVLAWAKTQAANPTVTPSA